jgi:ribosomal protein L11 methyltransferase
MSRPSPALVLAFPADFTAADRDRLVALLAEAGLVAIQEDDVTRPSRWTAHFVDADARDQAARIVPRTAGFANVTVEALEIEDDDWARRTQADLPAVRVGRLIVAPPWDLPAAAELDGHSILVEIEPSRGFGTGHHQSTRLCLTLLQQRQLSGRAVIDVGTGSGVLAIAAARLGARPVVAIDVDPDAVENAQENAARNGVADIVDVAVLDLSAATLPAADVVTANLTGTLLQRHAGDLLRLTRPGGLLIVSGFTEEEAERVLGAFSPRAMVASAEEEGWMAYAIANP